MELREKNLAVALIVPAKINIIEALDTGTEKASEAGNSDRQAYGFHDKTFRIDFLVMYSVR